MDTVKQKVSVRGVQKKGSIIRDLKKNMFFILMSMPAIIQVIIFAYIPMFGVVLAFKDIDYSKGIFEMDWVGLKNFEFLFKNPAIYDVLRNTVGYNAVFLLIDAVAPATVAIALSLIRGKRTARIYHALIMLPYFLSWVVVAALGYAMMEYDLGVFNNVLDAFGLDTTIWYKESEYWPYIYVFLHLWKGVGYGSIVYYATIMGIDTALYEAAAIDGASVLTQIKIITVPHLKGLVIMYFILGIGKILTSGLGMFYVMPNGSGALTSVSNTLDVFVYNALRTSGDMALSSAAGFFKSVVGFVLVITTNHIVKKIDKEQALY